MNFYASKQFPGGQRILKYISYFLATQLPDPRIGLRDHLYANSYCKKVFNPSIHSMNH